MFSYRTILSYPTGCAVPKINFFSNPDVFFEGQPTGTDTENNARMIRENMVSRVTRRRWRRQARTQSNVPVASLLPVGLRDCHLCASLAVTVSRPCFPCFAGASGILPSWSAASCELPITSYLAPFKQAATAEYRQNASSSTPVSSTTPMPTPAPTPEPVVTEPPVSSSPRFAYFGCFQDSKSNRVLSGPFVKRDPAMTAAVSARGLQSACIARCSHVCMSHCGIERLRQGNCVQHSQLLHNAMWLRQRRHCVYEVRGWSVAQRRRPGIRTP